MDNQDQRRTHTQVTGHEGHGVHVCHKCGWLFPNPHPSAKHRRAHKKVCGTIEGCKVLVSESQTRSYALDDDDEPLFNGHYNTIVDSVPKSLDVGDNEKQSGGTRENLIRSGDEVFLDAIANFSDGALSPGIRESLRDSLESATDVERVVTKYPEFLGYYEDNCFNAAGASENVSNVVRDCGLTSVAEEINLKGKDEIKSDKDMFEILVSSNSTVGETSEGVPELVVSDMINLHCQVAGEAINLKDAEFLSVMPQDELLLEVNSTVRTKGSANGAERESADMIQFATSSNVKMFQERGEGNINLFTHPWCDDGHDVAHPQNKYEDVKNHEIRGLLLQNSLSLHSSEALKQKRDGLKDSVAGGNSFLVNQHQLSERREVLPDVHVLDSSINKQNSEFVDEVMHAEESIEVSSVKFIVESDNRLVKTGAFTHAMKSEMNERCMIHFSKEQESNDDHKHKNSQKISLPECSSSKENLSDDRTIRTQKGVECTDRAPISGAQEDIKDDEINIDGKGNEECNRFVGSSVDSYQAQDEELIVKAAQCVSFVEDAQDGQPGREVFGSNVVSAAQVQSEDKIASPEIYTSDDPGSCFDSFSFKANSGSASVSGLSSTNLPVSTEAGKFNFKGPALERQQCEKPELFEPPSFMTLVEPGNVVGPKAAASEFHKGTNGNTSSQAGWFPTITHVANESQGRKRNEEKIAEITKCTPIKQHTPLKTLLSEATNIKKPKSPKSEEISVHHKNSHESPATQAGKGKDGIERNSPARYPAHTKRQNKKKVKGRPHWIQFVCCSSTDPQRS